jgi:hypothetical protein
MAEYLSTGQETVISFEQLSVPLVFDSTSGKFTTQYSLNTLQPIKNTIYNSGRYFDFSTIPIGDFYETYTEAHGYITPVFYPTPWSNPDDMDIPNNDNCA